MLPENQAVLVDNVSKTYKLYNSQRQRLLEAFAPWGKKRHREFRALDEICFTVKNGETFGIIGQNGSGKSTLLKIITGVLSQSVGKVKVCGRVAALLELGAGFHPEFTGVENIYLNGSILGLSREEVEAKLPEIIKFADIGDHLYQPIKTYSSGMFVRLAFAIAINVDPDILIVDEALSVGDIFFQVKCYRKFEEFKQRGKTILFVTHDLSTIIKYCDRAIVLERGKKVGEGSPREMVDLYKRISAKTEPSGKYDLKAEPRSLQVVEWKSQFPHNSALQSYGTGEAAIIDYGVFDQRDALCAALTKSEDFAIKMRVKFNAPISDPIFAVTIRDRKGTEVCGTNTKLEKHPVPFCVSGDIWTITFRQTMNLQGGQYVLSLGCTGFDDKGDFIVYSRLYDALQFDVISDKNTIGFFDMNSLITISQEAGVSQ
jgi:teichoic acid transport system ATP-binding protein